MFCVKKIEKIKIKKVVFLMLLPYKSRSVYPRPDVEFNSTSGLGYADLDL